MPNFTTEDLLLFMYNEMSDFEKTAMEQELQNNWALREKLLVLKESWQSLQKLKLQGPRKQTVEAIMAYASNPRHTNAPNPSIELIWAKGK
jgi:hypothetical protein